MYSLNPFIMISSLNALAVFDPDGENHEEYKKIHKSYKDMVRKLYFFSPTVCSRFAIWK